MISNYASKNKINSAISMSGTGYNIWALNKLSTAKMVSMHLANVSGCPTYKNSLEIISCLNRMEPDVIVANQLFTLVSHKYKRDSTSKKLARNVKVVANCINYSKPVFSSRPLNQTYLVRF